MQCGYFDAGVCRSCTLMGQPYPQQLADKQERCSRLLRPSGDIRWAEPFADNESGFRNKAKMVIGGSVTAPTIGILDPSGHGVDLRHCGICSPALTAAFPVLAAFVTSARIPPYDVPTRRGELKFLLLTEAPTGGLQLRFVLRSREALPRIRRQLPALLAALPTLQQVSVNLQPEHKAVVEGEEEIALHGPDALPMPVNGLTLYLRPGGFFQTNTAVAAALYRQARSWASALATDNRNGMTTVWDLYCGVGGFALHLAGAQRRVLGVETSAEAVAGARRSAVEAGLDVTFRVGDATAFALGSTAPPDLVVVNPPRRGIGVDLAGWLQNSGVRRVLYSSCNAESLARDLTVMPSLRPVRARVFDMFPQTTHCEVLVELARS